MSVKILEDLELSPEAKAVSEAVVDKIDFDKEGLINQGENVFEETNTKERVESVIDNQRHVAMFSTGLLHAFATKAIPKMKEEGFNRATGSFKVGLETLTVNITAPSGRKADGTMKDPVVTTISRRAEHEDYGKVRSAVYDAYRALND